MTKTDFRISLLQSISCRVGVRQALVALVPVVAFVTAWAGESRVPYVPTPQSVVDAMLEAGKVGPRDYLIDLGSGDGRIVVTAAKKFGARGFGVDLNPERIRESNENARAAGVTDRVSFRQQDLFSTDLKTATVITMYLLPSVNLELRPKLLELAPGTRLVSHDFDMGDWKADAQSSVNTRDRDGNSAGRSDIFSWIVPARVSGAWQWQLTVAGKPRSYELRLDQKFQELSGTVVIGGREARIQGGRMQGSDIVFGFTADLDGAPVKHEFTGKVDGTGIAGSAALSGARFQAQLDWGARRTSVPGQAFLDFPQLAARGGLN